MTDYWLNETRGSTKGIWSGSRSKYKVNKEEKYKQETKKGTFRRFMKMSKWIRGELFQWLKMTSSFFSLSLDPADHCKYWQQLPLSVFRHVYSKIQSYIYVPAENTDRFKIWQGLARHEDETLQQWNTNWNAALGTKKVILPWL